ncbi:MAG: hypothetical protein ACREDT_04005 [Methylocella sp.]
MRTAVAHTMARANPICNTAREIGAAMYPTRASPGAGHIADGAARAETAGLQGPRDAVSGGGR